MNIAIPEYILDRKIENDILIKRIDKGDIFEENESIATINRTLESFSKGHTNYLRYQIIPENENIHYDAIINEDLLKSLAVIITNFKPEQDFCWFIFDELFKITEPKIDYTTNPPTNTNINPTDHEKYLKRMNDILRLCSKWISDLHIHNLKIDNPISYIFPNFIYNFEAVLLSISAIHHSECEKLTAHRHTDIFYTLRLDEIIGGGLTKGRIYSLIEKIYKSPEDLEKLTIQIISYYEDPKIGSSEDTGVAENRIRNEIRRLEKIAERSIVRASKKWWYVDLTKVER